MRLYIIMGLGTQCCKTAECPLRPATYTVEIEMCDKFVFTNEINVLVDNRD